MATTVRYPGAELIEPGIAALGDGRVTDEALLVRLVRGRLDRAGFPTVPPDPELEARAADDLYARLADRYGDGAHSRYNALVRRVIAFCQAVENDQTRRHQSSG